MTKHSSCFHILLIGIFMLSMLMPVVHADHSVLTTTELSQTATDCHSDTASHATHETQSHCTGDVCLCMSAQCHNSALLDLSPLLMSRSDVAVRLSYSNAHLV
uniref:hypothetical protein n=1 Tax=Methylophaga lonarensis TaxID=999151 RepID=UPI003D29346F